MVRLDIPETLRSALADRYAIERELGQGGMATVYLAEDLRHHRKVALKVLRPEIAVTVGAGRFSREIETIFALAVHRDGRRGIWAIPAAGGAARLVIWHDDPILENGIEGMSVGPDRIYLTVAQNESDIWVAKLRY